MVSPNRVGSSVSLSYRHEHCSADESGGDDHLGHTW